MKFDRVDVDILQALQRDAHVKAADLAESLDISLSPLYRRIRLLEEAGVITKYVSLLDQEKVGFPINAYVSVAIEKSAAKLAAFERAILSCEEVMECYLMTGDSDYLLRDVVPDIVALQNFIVGRLTKTRGVANIRSSFALKQVKYKTALPLEELRDR